MSVKMCEICGKNPIPYLDEETGIQSGWRKECNECANTQSSIVKESSNFQLKGPRIVQKNQRNIYFKVWIIGGIDENTGLEKILYEGDETRVFEREARPLAIRKLKELGGIYAIVRMINRHTDQQFIIARYVWQTKVIQKIVNKIVEERMIQEKLGD